MENDKFQEMVIEQLQGISQKLGKHDEHLEVIERRLEQHDQLFDKLGMKIMQISENLSVVARNQVSMENILTENIKGLYDFREIQKEHNQRVDEGLERIEKKIEVLQLETAHLRRIK